MDLKRRLPSLMNLPLPLCAFLESYFTQRRKGKYKGRKEEIPAFAPAIVDALGDAEPKHVNT